jgi:hypothetical protein
MPSKIIDPLSRKVFLLIARLVGVIFGSSGNNVIRFSTIMKKHLFYTFLVIFGATAVVALLGVTGVIGIQEGYLTPLVAAFLIELGGAVIAIFKGANFFEEAKGTIAAEAEIRDSLRKLDRAFGNNHDRLNAFIVNIEAELLSLKYLAKTPMTDMLVAINLVEKYLDTVDEQSMDRLLSSIVDILKTGIGTGSAVRPALLNLAAKLPEKYAGQKEQLLFHLKKRSD